MLEYLRLIRIQNLLIIPLTMYLLHYGIVEPALSYGYSIALNYNIQPQLTQIQFLILISINMLLGAAGYVINDYFDRKIDRINRPNKVIVEKSVSRRAAITLHSVLNGIAILLSVYLAWVLKKPLIVLVYLMIGGFFWLYSTTYKHQFLIGNLIVALGTAMIPIQTAYFELTPLVKVYGNLFATNGISFKALFFWLAAFGLFAFLTNLIREIVKDIEDFEGDSSYGSNTIPVILGIKQAKIVAAFLSVGTATLLAYFYFKFLNDSISLWYLGIFVVLPLLAVAVGVLFAKTAKHYHKISTLLKIIMLFGVLFSLVARYIMTYNFSIL